MLSISYHGFADGVMFWMGDSLLGELLEGIGFIMGLLFGCFLEKIIVISIARCALSTMNCPQRYDFLHLFLQYSIVLLLLYCGLFIVIFVGARDCFYCFRCCRTLSGIVPIIGSHSMIMILFASILFDVQQSKYGCWVVSSGQIISEPGSKWDELPSAALVPWGNSSSGCPKWATCQREASHLRRQKWRNMAIEDHLIKCLFSRPCLARLVKFWIRQLQNSIYVYLSLLLPISIYIYIHMCILIYFDHVA